MTARGAPGVFAPAGGNKGNGVLHATARGVRFTPRTHRGFVQPAFYLPQQLPRRESAGAFSIEGRRDY